MFIKNIKCFLSALIICAISVVCLSDDNNQCTNPNHHSGNCISIYKCTSLLAVVRRKPLQEKDRQFLLRSQCSNGSGRLPHVCCTEDTDYTMENMVSRFDDNMPTVKVAPSNGQGNILPTPPNCGKSPLVYYIYKGKDTAIDEFPWMVLLEYEKNGARKFRCGGSLINQRYVLTAAHCVTGYQMRSVGTLVTVRLGEYRISTDVDCVLQDCADPIVEMGVENVIWHSQFTDRERYHDIALIRMNGDVTYSDFIRPICMPTTVELPAIVIGEYHVVSGWGKTLSSNESDVKQKLNIPYVDHAECTRLYSTKKLPIIPSQLCAGGRSEEDSCSGDSGGPLMRSKATIWALEGIISYGNQCGIQGWPGVYTKVADYEDWIRSNLRP